MGAAVWDRLEAARILPVVTVSSPDVALRVFDALSEGGLPAVEITFRTPAAADAIAAVAEQGRATILAAGTVRTVDQARQAIEAGADLLVSPGTSVEVVRYCRERGVETVPGVFTATEAGVALDLGVRVLKFFPAEPHGGVATLRALSAVYPDARFIPTGGIHAGNLREYLNAPPVLACGGSWLTPADLIAAERYDRITELTREAVALTRALR